MSIVAMKRKYNEKKKAKITQKNRRGRTCCPDSTDNNNFKSYNTTMTYGSFMKRKTNRCLCPGDSGKEIPQNRRFVVKDRVNRRIDYSQRIEQKKLAVLQRIRCDSKENPNNNPVWTFTINSQVINESAGVVVTQGNKSGTLKTALSGATITVVIYGAKGDIWDNSTNLVIGNTTVTAANVVTAYNKNKCGITRSRVGYTRKESILRFCNTTKDLKYAGSGKSYNEIYENMKIEKAFTCDDFANENPKNN